mmetsp:Transcript_11150/g.25275  ORF Transcript_11150/g.25275 Transcript_11150/m.25275 type:complete len:1446 (-) Transcript_11150:72-4409(-)
MERAMRGRRKGDRCRPAMGSPRALCSFLCIFWIACSTTLALENGTIVPANGPGAGGFTVTLHGRDLGDGDLGQKARLGGTACDATTWLSLTTIYCQVASYGGAGIDKSVVVTISKRNLGFSQTLELDVTGKFSFDSPKITALANYNGPSFAGIALAVLGSDFARTDWTAKMSLGSTACETTRWRSESTIFCQNAPSTSDSLPITLTMFNSATVSSIKYSYDKQKIMSISPSNAVTIGSQEISIVGQGFGVYDVTPRARLQAKDKIDGQACLSSTWISDSIVKCKVPQGSDAGVSISLTIEEKISTIFDVFTYNSPEVTAISPINMPLTGRQITAFGKNFGFQNVDRSLRLGDTVCMSFLWLSDSSVTCLSNPAYGDKVDVILTVAKNLAVLPASLTYDGPYIESVRRSNGPASGQTTITFRGANFGAYQLTPRVRVGDTTCIQTNWVSQSEIRCRLAPVTYDGMYFRGISQKFDILVGTKQKEVPNGFTYDQTCVGPCVGSLLCDASSDGKATGCDGSTSGDRRHSYNSVRVSKDGFSGTSVLRVHGNFTVSGGEIKVGNTTHFTIVRPTEQIYNNDVNINFGGIFPCEILLPAVGDSSSVQQYVDCVMPPGVGFEHRIQVKIRNATYKALVDGCTASMKLFGQDSFLGQPWGNCYKPTVGTEYVYADDFGLTYSYSKPTISKLTPGNAPNMQNSSIRITIEGNNFGGAARELYKTSCGASTERACLLMNYNGAIFFNKTCPSVDLLALNAETGAQVRSEVEGRKLALCATEHAITFKCVYAFTDAYTTCIERCSLASMGCGRNCPDDKLICEALPFGGIQTMTLVIGGMSSNGFVFSYDKPQVWSVFPPELLAGSSSLLTVVGLNFGVDLSAQYAGRQVSAEGVTTVAYDSQLVPVNASSIAWWDFAQFQMCFSSINDATAAELNQLVAQGTVPADMLSSYRKCDGGVVFSDQIVLSNIIVNGVRLQQMIVQSPSISLPSGEVRVRVDTIMQSLGSRSQVATSNSTISFRAACRDFSPNLGSDIIFFTQATVATAFTARNYFATASYVDGTIKLAAGRTQSIAETKNIYSSSFDGINGWYEYAWQDAAPWFSERSNITMAVFKDILVVLGGYSMAANSFFNDVWIFAEDTNIRDVFATATTPQPKLAKGETFRGFWIKVTSSAVWSARSNAQAVEFQEKLWLIGGQGTEGWTFDIWMTVDLKKWSLVETNAVWKGRNNIFALVYRSKLWVVGSVQAQFYNTFSSPDGYNWEIVPNSCALTMVDVQAAVAYRDYMMLFTLGCHDYTPGQHEKPTACSSTQSGPQLENRIFYSTDGVVWRLARRPFTLNSFLVPEFHIYEWVGRSYGEYRYGYGVLVHQDTLYIIAGQQHQAYRDSDYQLILSSQQLTQYREIYMNDIWVSKGLVPLTSICGSKSDLTPAEILSRLQSTQYQPCANQLDIFANVEK